MLQETEQIKKLFSKPVRVLWGWALRQAVVRERPDYVDL
jgi:hypothetical protein